MDSVILSLNKISKDYIGSDFYFDKKNPLLYVNSGLNMSQAINIRKNGRQQVSVSNWFDDIWLYIEIKGVLKPIKSKKVFPNIFFSLSVFQGDSNDDEKTQLFRAEWDNYETPSNNHPQPHWHIYPHKYSSNIHQSFEDYLDLGKTDNDFNNYIGGNVINDTTIIKIEKFHFAMNGQWSNNSSDVHTIASLDELTDWFAGVLNHIKNELKYVKGS